MDDLLKVFLAETTECLGEIDADAAALRSSPDDAARLDKVVRLLRSVRETSGFLGLPTLHAVARDVVEQLERAPAEADADIGALVADGATKLRATVVDLQQPAPPARAPAAPKKEAVGDAVLATKRPRRKKAAAGSAPAPQPAKQAPPAAVPASAGAGEGSPSPMPLPEPTIPVAVPAPSLPEPAPMVVTPPVTVEPTAEAADGSIRVSAGTVEQLLATVARLMAAQTEMMQILRAGPRTDATPPAAPAEAEVAGSDPQPAEAAAGATAESKPAAASPQAVAGPDEALDKGSDKGPEKSKVVSLPPRRAPAATEAGLGSPVAAQGPAQGPAKGSAGIRLLLFRAADGTLKAVAFDQVARLEEVDLRKVDGSRGLWVMRSGAELLPLVPFDAGRRLPERGVAPVIIVAIGSQWFGLLVEAVLEVVDATLAIAAAADQPGHIGTALFGGRVVDVIDPGHYLPEPLRTGVRSPAARRKRPQPQPEPQREVRPVLPESDLFVRKPARDVGS
jgi:chemotaxis protein histidine kinase CheA